MPRALLTSFLLILLASLALSQNAQILQQQGEKFFSSKNYEQAILNFEAAKKIEPKNVQVLYLLGASYYFKNDFTKATESLNQYLNLQKSPSEEVFFYLGKIHHSNYEFSHAVKFYKDFLKKSEKNDVRRRMIKSEILRCAAGMALMQNFNKIIVENLGKIINSNYDEITPFESPNDPSLLYFSTQKIGGQAGTNAFAKGIKHNFKIRYSQSKNGKWSPVLSIASSAKPNHSQILLGFSPNGSKMYLLNSPDVVTGNIFFKYFQSENQIFDTNKILPYGTNPIPFESSIQSEKGDGTPHFFNENILIFSSREREGFGGLDLYWSKLENGVWSEPKNLGKPINSEFDETSPFLSKDGRTLYYSSNHHRRSMGGLDILKSTFHDEIERWSEPANLGFPINSADDDMHFRFLKNGKSAYFTSNRQKGFGGFDIYATFFNEVLQEHLIESHPIAFFEVTGQKEEFSEAVSSIPEKEVKVYKVQIISSREKESELRVKFPNLIMDDSSIDPEKISFTIRTYRTLHSAELFKKDLVRQGYEEVIVIEFVE